MERTEEQKLTQAPIVVVLGGKEYEVKPLVIKESRLWRQKITELWASLPRHLKVTTEEVEKFEAALSALLVTMPDVVIDLFFDYAKDLDRKQIELVATESEIGKAFEQVVEVAFPLSQSLMAGMTEVIAPKRKGIPKKKSR